MRRLLALALALALLAPGPLSAAGPAAAPPSFVVLAGGTVAAADVHLSTVAGTAFAWIDGVDLSPYYGARITFTDTAGRSAVAYIKAAGTGETLGANTFALNPDFAAAAGWSLTGTWSIGGGKATHTAVDPGSVTQGNNTSGQLVRWTVTVTDYAQGPVYALPGNATAQGIFGGTQVAGTTYEKYYTSLGASSAGFYAGPTGDLSIDDVKHEPVLTPPVTGVTLVTAKAGTTYNFRSISANFDPNAVTRYRVERDLTPALVHSGTAGAGLARLSLVDGTAFADPDIGEDWSNFQVEPHLLVLQDPSGKTVGGFVLAGGAGETFSAEILNDPGMETWTSATNLTSWDEGGNISIARESVEIHGGTYSALLTGGGVPSDTSSNWLIGTPGLTFQALYTSSAWVKRHTGVSSVYVGLAYGPHVSASAVAAWTQLGLYSTLNWTSAPGQRFNIAATTGDRFYVDDASVRQVLTPSATGITIRNTRAGAVQNWLWKDTGFNPNAVLAFRFYYLGY